MKNQISPGASVPGAQSPTNDKATGCDDDVRKQATTRCALHPSDAPCEPGRYVSAAGTGARSPTGSCEPGTCGFARLAAKETP